VLALFSNSSGYENTANGTSALQGNTTGYDNTASGFQALYFNTTGADNTAHGAYALLDNNTGFSNTATGVAALEQNVTGNNNTAMGVDAQVFNQTGSGNTSVGVNAMANNTGGNNNTAVGFKALRKSLGTKNIGIGYQAGVTLTTGNNNIYIGHSGAGDESQTIRIGTAQTQTFVAGINTTGVSGTAVIVNSNGQIGVTLSSARYKRDIEAIASRSEGLLKLRPVTFSYKEDTAAAPHYGLIAEEVATVYPELVTRNAEGDVQTVKYHELIPMLLNELQRQRQSLERQEQALQRQQQELADLRALVGQGRRAETRPPGTTVAARGTVTVPQ
jgi:Chaperone of endosialidase